MRNVTATVIILVLLASYQQSWAQQASNTAQHLIKFSFGSHWNPLVGNDIGYGKSPNTVYLQKGTPRTVLGTRLGMEWEWMFSRRWSLQTGALFEAKKLNFAAYNGLH